RPGLLFSRGVALARGEIAQRAQTTFSNDAFGSFVDGGKDAADAARFIANRTVRKREVALLRITIALEQQQEIIGPGSFSTLKDTAEHGANRLPDLRPAILSGGTQGRRVFGSEDLLVSVVVEHHQFSSPPHHDGKAGIEADADGSAKALRP